MNFLTQYLLRQHRWLMVGMGVLIIGVAALLWPGAKQAQAGERPAPLFQTIPPTPTPAPTTPPPTPTRRPRDNKDDDKNDNPPATPTPTPVGETTPASSATTSTLTGVINATTLNVRQGPGANFPVIGRLPNGTVVTVEARNADNTWLNICCLPDGQTQGWVSAQFVTPNYSAADLNTLPIGNGATLVAGITPVATPVATATALALPAGAPQGAVVAVSLNVRAAPSTDAAILGKLSNGTTVALLGRNAASDWWLICCIPGATENGWVSAQFITTEADAATLAALPVTTGRDTPVAAPLTQATATPVATEEAPTPTALALVAALQPAFPMQGDQVVLALTLTNTGAAAAVNAELSFETPAGLSFVGVSAEDGGEATALDTDGGNTLIVVTWPELAAGSATTAKITLMVAPSLENGAVIDGAAAALADNAEATSVAISLGMPPASPPDFQ